MGFNRAFLKWAGSKYNCLHHILPALPSGCRLIEPFAGSGVVCLNSNYSSYLLAENNFDLISIFTQLQEQGESFIKYCQQLFLPQFNSKEKYYEFREEFNTLSPSMRKSALFLYLNRHGYNGLCRYNSKGKYNVPFGLVKPYFPLEEMRYFYQKSQSVTFIHNDFRKTFTMAEPGDVIYCDPPYVAFSEQNKTFAYTQTRFEDEDQIELAQLAMETAAKGIPVIISNHDTKFTRYHYQQAEIKSFAVSRLINCQGDLRHPVGELLAIFK